MTGRKGMHSDDFRVRAAARHRLQWTNEMRAEMLRLIHDGETVSEIARRVGVCRNTLATELLALVRKLLSEQAEHDRGSAA